MEEKNSKRRNKTRKNFFYWNGKDIKLPNQFLTRQVIEDFKNIEIKSEFPQDIEWCIKDNQFYLLQTRPITTITTNNTSKSIFRKTIIGRNIFEKTEISEIAPRPTEFILVF